MSQVTLEDIAQQIGNLATEVKAQGERLAHVETQITELRSEFKTEVQRWDERFFQLSKDSLSFVRNVITAGVFVAILVTTVKDLVPAVLQFFK